MLTINNERKLYRFVYNGQEYAVTSLDSIPYEKAKEARNLNDDNAAAEWIVKEVFEVEAPEVIKTITSGNLAELLKDYLSSAETNLGESEA